MDKLTVAPMPAAFFRHGSPMNALEANRYTEAYSAPSSTCVSQRGISR